MERESKVTIKIPRPLYRKLQEIVDGTGFDSVTDFVVYILRDIVSRADTSPNGNDEREVLTADEVEKVRQRLKNVGYL